MRWGECRRPERRFSHRSAVRRPANRAEQWTIVFGSQLHEQVVGMLPVMNRVAIAELAGRQQIRVAAS